MQHQPSYELLDEIQEFVSEHLGEWPAGFAGNPQPRRKTPAWALFPRWRTDGSAIYLESSSGSRIATADFQSSLVKFSERLTGIVGGENTVDMPQRWHDEWRVFGQDGELVSGKPL